MINVRRRRRSEVLSDIYSEISDYDVDTRSRAPASVGYLNFFVLLVAVWSMYGLVFLAELNMPRPLLLVDESDNRGRFIAERAKQHVTHLSNLGPRPVGSLANEVLAVKYLTKTLTSMQEQANGRFTMTIDHQTVDGEFPLQFLDGLTSVYRNIQNIVVKVRPTSPSPSSGPRSAILLNCHYDSVVDSPGATDDLAACAVLLEVMRIIVTSDFGPLRHDLIFLFNGAEENLLQASHGFITQHRWAKNLLAVINMDACGAGGRELLFQTGPENPWLLESYAQSVKLPSASISAQEIFQSGMIPGDTDYRIFRDFGKIPGLDFAWAMGGYMYHTKLDSADYVPLESLQHAGDNILPLTLHMANLNCPQDCQPNGTMVFFDILHLYVFRISGSTATRINYLVVLLSAAIILWNAYKLSFRGVSRRRYLSGVVKAAVYLVCSWIFTVAVNAFLAAGFYSFNRSLSWFTRPIWIYFLYGIPALAIPLSFVVAATKHFKRTVRSASNWDIFTLFVDADQLVASILVLMGCLANIGSIFLITALVLFQCVSNLLKNAMSGPNKGSSWLWGYVVPALGPTVFLWYTTHGLFKIIIPIMGRAGAGLLPEVVIAALTTLVIIGIFKPLVPLIVMFSEKKRILKPLCLVFISSVLALLVTPLGFPYSSSLESPSPQRYTILHAHRVFYGLKGAQLSEQSGFWIVDLDPNSPNSVKSFVSDLAGAVPVDDCPHQLYCGLPYKIPIISMISKTHWIPGPKPSIHIPANLTVLRITEERETVKIDIQAQGPDHMSIIVSPVEGAILDSWSLANGSLLPGSKWNERETHFIYYSYGSYPGPLKFWMKFKRIDDRAKRSPYIADVAVTGHFLHGPHQKSVRLTKLLAQFPPWTVTSGWVASYTSYKV